MQRLTFALITFFIVLSGISCSTTPNAPWTKLVPQKTSFVILPAEAATFSDFIDTEYAHLLEDLTSGSLQQLLLIEQNALPQIRLLALAVFPATSTESQIIWITQSKASLKKWAVRFYEPLQQNYYIFNGITVHKIPISGTIIYAAQVNDLILFSYSSIALEASLRSYLGKDPAMSFASVPKPGDFILNTVESSNFAGQFAAVSYRPQLADLTSGLGSVTLSAAETAGGTNLSGNIAKTPEPHSAFIDAMTGENRPVQLDRYVAGNAAAFAVMHLEPHSVPISPQDELMTPLDSLLSEQISEYANTARLLDSPIAFVAFSESSLLSSGEYMYLRKTKNPNQLQSRLDNWAEQGLIQNSGNSYLINSSVLAKLIGSEMCGFKDFYLAFSGEVVAISKRRGLTESIIADVARRRVIYYEEDYAEARRDMPEEISGFFWARSAEFQKFLKPFLLPANVSATLFNRFDILSITLQKSGDNSIKLNIHTSSRQGSELPYKELWVTPLKGDLTGPPITGDIIGSSAKEIIFATTGGDLIAVAGDGTIVVQASTDGNIPVGSPILYDWYGNEQPVILLAAGTKIFGWNQSGSLLPRFPIEMNARITAPIVVTDVLRNGIPEIIAATDDRKIHIIDRRGENVSGWPQSVNAAVTSAPLFAEVDGTFSIWAFSQNVLHSWLRNGSTRPGYPQFTNAGFSGSPVEYKNSILGAGSDGYIYSFGRFPSFSDSLSMPIKTDSIAVKAVYVANSELLSLGVEKNILLRNDDGFYRSDLISTQSRNGSVFFIAPNGTLRLTQNLGQPASVTYHPELKDINSDKNQDVVALADFGRLFAWDVLTGERIYDLPTSGMTFPILTDLNNDGQLELIAQTREGLRCWTIYRAKK